MTSESLLVSVKDLTEDIKWVIKRVKPLTEASSIILKPTTSILLKCFMPNLQQTWITSVIGKSREEECKNNPKLAITKSKKYYEAYVPGHKGHASPYLSKSDPNKNTITLKYKIIIDHNKQFRPRCGEKLTSYALETSWNFFSASGSSLFISGWSFLASWRKLKKQ